MLRTFRFITLVLAGLGLTLGAAHALELPPKMQYDPELYATVTSTLYPLFGAVGAIIQLGAVLAAVTLTVMVRGRPAFRLTLLGTLGPVLSLVFLPPGSPDSYCWSCRRSSKRRQVRDLGADCG
jgi:hypothetical protein